MCIIGEKVVCKTIITNCDISILDFVDLDVCKERIMVIHADYSMPNYKVFPEWHDKRLTRIIAITKHIQQMMKETFNIETELCYNPIVPEEYKPRLKIISATRLSKIKGGTRMKALAEALDLARS